MHPNASAGKSRRLAAAAAGALVLVIVLAYGRTFSAPFIFDDFAAIRQNVTIRHLWPLTDVFGPPHELGSTVGGRPILNLTLALNYAVSGDDVWSYHVLNLAIHVGCALLLFGIVRRLALIRACATTPVTRRRNDSTLLAVTIAALWALHPLQTEAVTYLSQRAESLASCFYLLVAYGFVRATETSRPAIFAAEPAEPPAAATAAGDHAKTNVAWAAVSVTACCLGAATKEIVATAPALVLLLDAAVVAGSFSAAWRARRGYYLALALSWTLVAALVLSTHDRGGTAGFGTGVSVWPYVLTQAFAIVHYLRLAVWPTGLVFDYGTGLVDGLGDVWLRGLALVASLGASVAALFLGIRARRRRAGAGPDAPDIAAATALASDAVRADAAGALPSAMPTPRSGAAVAGFLGLAFFVLLSPSSSIVPVGSQTMAEHRMYLPLAAVIALAVLAARRAIGRWATSFGLVAAAAASVLTWQRNEVYRSGVTLWGDTAARVPGNARAHNNLGNALVSAGRFDAALPEYEAAVRLQPDYADAQSNLGHVLVQLGRPAEALPHEEIAVRLQPGSADVLLNYGLALTSVGRVRDAVPVFERALRLSPASLDAQFDLGNAYYRLGDFTAAVKAYEAVLRQQPERQDARFNLAYALLQLNRPHDALAEFQTVSRQHPDDAATHAEIGNLLAYFGRTAEAAAEFETALRLRPDFAAARTQLDQLRAAGPNR